ANDTVQSASSRLSVSSLLEKSEKTKSTATLDSAKALEDRLRLPSVGIKLHEMFEKLRYHSGRLAPAEPKLANALKYVTELTSPPMAELLKQGEVEWGFQIKTRLGLLEGQIDLWGTVAGQTWVIDYKSGSENYKERAFKQLELYAFALSRA